MQCAKLRQLFLAYFEEQGHRVVSSSSLIPVNDPSLLFTNAGMVQFKENFLGQHQADYLRAVTVQRCVRAGGKHNDLDNVGYTARHHTFFEMLGNFSFGDYFKREAIRFAWEFLTQRLHLSPEKFWVTVHQDDDEAAAIWLHEIGIVPQRLVRCGDKDNFWAMGETGPCGPCSEIFYDHGASVAGGPPGSADADGDRYMEIWNLVFMQYERSADGTLQRLPKPAVDTGMGLERLATVLQGVHDNYHIDLFQRLLAATAQVVGCQQLDQPSLRVIADHIRSTAFLIADGVLPSNEGRGYVLRRIIRRACRHGHKLGGTTGFFHQLVPALVAEMGEAYPELRKAQASVQHILQQEEEQFARTLSQGLRLFEQDVAGLAAGATIPGDTVFKLYDTYGFPVDLTADIARERQLHIDLAGFTTAMDKQRQQSQQASRFSATAHYSLPTGLSSLFTGYTQLKTASTVLAVLQDGQTITHLSGTQQGVVVLDKTPFYAESGGQVGDVGQLIGPRLRFTVRNTQKQGDVYLHYGELVEGELRVGDNVEAQVDNALRQATACNHSATHLLHAALCAVLGAHVQQKGSLVQADKLRFDFSHGSALSVAEIDAVERCVNQQICANLQVLTELMPVAQALESGAQALFGEKYADTVRVLSMGSFSKELCGGTHVQATGEIGLFKIVSEAAIAAGIRRIEAITASVALQAWQDQAHTLYALSQLMKTEPEQLATRIQQLLDKQRSLERTLEQARTQLVLADLTRWTARAKSAHGVACLIESVEDVDAKTLRDMATALQQALGSSVILLASVAEGKVTLLASVTSDLCQQIPAGELVAYVAKQVGGKGGGRAEMAQGGGTQPQALDSALQAANRWVMERLVKPQKQTEL